MVNLFRGVAVMLHPFITRVGFQAGDRIGKDSFFLFMAASFALLGFKLPKEILVFTIGLMFLAFFNQWNFMSGDVFYQYVMFLSGIILFGSFYQGADISKYFVYSATLIAIYVILEKMGVNLRTIYLETFYNIEVKRTVINNIPAGPLNHPNLTGAYLALSLPLFLKNKAYICLPAVIFALFLGDSIMPLATASAVAIFLLNSHITKAKPILLYLCASLTMVILYFTGLNGLDSHRFLIWSKSMSIFAAPFLGEGLGWFSDAFAQNFPKMTQKVYQEHNEFLSLFYSFGAIGLLYACHIFNKMIKTTDIYIGAGLFAMFINFYGNFTMHVSTLAALCLFYMATSLKGVRCE